MTDGDALAHPPPFPEILAVMAEEDWRHFGDDPAIASDRCYNFYAAYGAAFRPGSILEIGVRRGYSAFALIKGAAGAVRRFVGLDVQEEGPQVAAAARRLLTGLGVPGLELIDVDTQSAFPALAGGFALVHVDADHSTRGCLSDLANALPLLAAGGVMVVDDCDSPPVMAGVQAFLGALGPATRRRRIDTYRGHMLIWPDERAAPADLFGRLPPWTSPLIDLEDLLVAVRRLPSQGLFALRARGALAARLLAGVTENAPVAPLPTGVLPGLTALLERAERAARRVEQAPRAAACRPALDEVRRHIAYARERAGRNAADDRALLGEFSVHAANFAGSVAPLLLMPQS